MLSSFFEKTGYVTVKRNQFRIRHLESGTEATFDARPTFTSTRLLIGEFRTAEALLKQGLRQVLKSSFISVRPYVVIQPLEMVEGGLSEVEERIFKEVAIGAGASKAVVWVGPQLSDADVKAKLKS
jgi:rod shape-determining protein MreB and related proteins